MFWGSFLSRASSTVLTGGETPARFPNEVSYPTNWGKYFAVRSTQKNQETSRQTRIAGVSVNWVLIRRTWDQATSDGQLWGRIGNVPDTSDDVTARPLCRLRAPATTTDTQANRVPVCSTQNRSSSRTKPSNCRLQGPRLLQVDRGVLQNNPSRRARTESENVGSGDVQHGEGKGN